MAVKRSLTLLFLWWFCSRALPASEIKIGLFYGTEVQSAVFTAVEGEYMLSGDSMQVTLVREGSIIFLVETSRGLEVHDTTRSFGSFQSLEFRGRSGVNVFRIKSVVPASGAKESDDDLLVYRGERSIRLINRFDLEKYISGTVESEGGSNALPEYYKAQAVITRTFALKNHLRHAREGFNLCDGVHCQAFNGKSRMNRDILAAVYSTRGEVLTGQDGTPVIAAYHANCGGITGSASVEWNGDLYYLSPVSDPFCVKSSHHNWVKSIPLKEWNEFLGANGIVADTPGLYNQGDAGRQKYLDKTGQKLPLAGIRDTFKLKSSYFYVVRNNDSVEFHGHGYGHGLGLCQEGAMEMARVGFTYVDILMFYFRGLELKRL
jgi:stage II sporulation protein D